MSAAAAERLSEHEHSNDVHLVGRVTADPVERELPSGDLLVQWRLSVERDPAQRTVSKATVDVLECCAVRAALRRTVGSWRAGDVVEIEGALRRRFWRAESGPQSRYEVEVRAARRLARG